MTGVHQTCAVVCALGGSHVARAAFICLFALIFVSNLAPLSRLLADSEIRSRSRIGKADTSRSARDNAIRSIPIEKLDSGGRIKVASVLSRLSFFRRMPLHVTSCDPDMYLFLVRHPDVVVNIWQVLGVGQLKLRQIDEDTYTVADIDGLTGKAVFLYRSHDTHVVYVASQYKGPLFAKPLVGEGLLVLKTGYVREPDGRYYVTSRLDTFMRVDDGGVEFLTKTFHPLVGNVADTNFIQTSSFLGSLSRTAEVNNRGVQRLAARLYNVEPGVRKEFAEVANRVAKKASTAKQLVQNVAMYERLGRTRDTRKK